MNPGDRYDWLRRRWFEECNAVEFNLVAAEDITSMFKKPQLGDNLKWQQLVQQSKQRQGGGD